MSQQPVPARYEWRVLASLLPAGWREAARQTGAIQRDRFWGQPDPLLRLLLLHAAGGNSLRETVTMAHAAGIASMTSPALLKRLRRCGDWLSWIAQYLCLEMRAGCALESSRRVRVVDSTTVNKPASRGTDHRLHYSLDLRTCTCDWFELTDAHGGEHLQRVPMQPGDIMIADRGYFRAGGIVAAAQQGAFVLLRMSWQHPKLLDEHGQPFVALEHVDTLNTGDLGVWTVQLPPSSTHPAITARVIIAKLPAIVAAAKQKDLTRKASKKSRQLKPGTLKAAGYVMLLSTIPEELMSATQVAQLYQCRWQVELAFKRLKQLMSIGYVPHKDPAVARTWILGKLVTALLLEKLYRRVRGFSPWGYDLATIDQA